MSGSGSHQRKLITRTTACQREHNDETCPQRSEDCPATLDYMHFTSQLPGHPRIKPDTHACKCGTAKIYDGCGDKWGWCDCGTVNTTHRLTRKLMAHLRHAKFEYILAVVQLHKHYSPSWERSPGEKGPWVTSREHEFCRWKLTQMLLIGTDAINIHQPTRDFWELTMARLSRILPRKTDCHDE